jgi:hypothetical protein
MRSQLLEQKQRGPSRNKLNEVTITRQQNSEQNQNKKIPNISYENVPSSNASKHESNKPK